MGKARRLIRHPDAPAAGVTGIEASISRTDSGARLAFTVAGEAPLIPPPAAPVRTDGLWQTTCFELFVQPAGGEAYFEFNFSPSTAWAAYAFDGYRAGMRALPLAPPLVEPVAKGIRVVVDLSALPGGDWRVGLSAVIEEQGGTKSYWALAHPPGKPDFHHADCFALELAAAG